MTEKRANATLEYKGKTRNVTVRVLGRTAFEKRFRSKFRNKKQPYYYRHLGILPGATAVKNAKEIVVCAGNEGNIKLLGHEAGHLFGLPHTSAPTTMNHSRVFRWADPECLVPVGRQVAEAIARAVEAEDGA